MTTVVIQIGNSDNKLTQVEWSQFVAYTRDEVQAHSDRIHFDGGCRYDAPWQNACFVSEVFTENQEPLREQLRRLAYKFRQDSIAITVGETTFEKG